MTLADWLGGTRRRFRDHPPAEAAARSAVRFVQGGIRRTVDPWLGTPIWELDDWDICVVLDACRVDLLREVVDDYDWLPNGVGSYWSVASCSADWLARTVAEPRPEAGYITGNPFTDNAVPFNDALPLDGEGWGHWDEAWQDAWGEHQGVRTTPPEALCGRTVRAWRRKELDQLVVHLMQPHQPFRLRPLWWSGDGNLADLVGPTMEADICIWQELSKGHVDEADVWQAYRDNLRWGLEAVSRLRQNADARILLTADHGNTMGRWYQWGHPPASVVPEVRRVPAVWVDGRDEETWQPDVKTAGVDAATDDQLAALGYKI